MRKFLAILIVLALLAGGAYHAYDYITSRPLFDDLDAAKENLENADYVVTYMTQEDMLGSYLADEGIVKYFVASENDSEDDNILLIAVFESKELAKIYYKQMKNQLDAMIKDTKLEIQLLEYKLENSDDLTDDEIEDLKEEIEDYKEDLKEYKNIVMGREGATFWYGTKDAAKASKG